MDLSDALTLFLADCEFEDLSPKTIDWYRKMISPFTERGGDIGDISRQDTKEFLKAQKARGVMPETVRGFGRALRRFFNWAIEEELIEETPMKNVRVPKRDAGLPKTVSLEDVIRLLSTCENSVNDIRDRAIIWTLYDTGCRAGGLLGLRLHHINFDWLTILLTEKNGKPRFNPILPETAGMLRDWLNARPNAPSDAVFIGLKGPPLPLQYDGLRTMLKRRGKRGGCEGPVNPHSFRHAFAKEYILNGGDQMTLADLMGHKDPSMTKLYYAVFNFEELKKPHYKYSPANQLGV